MVDLPTIPYGGIISLGMIVGSLFTKKNTSKFLLYGGLGLGVYNLTANILWAKGNIAGFNELVQGIQESFSKSVTKSSNYGTYNTMPYGEF